MKQPKSGLIDETKLGIATDLYQLTMAYGYEQLERQDEIATFDLFVRTLPKNRSYLVVAGLEQALHYLTTVRFGDEEIEHLRNLQTFENANSSFWEYLRNFEFTGDVNAMPEGTIAFGNEPLMTVNAPLIEAQIAETYLLTCYNHQTKIASKAARVYEASKGRPVIEFGMRRTDIGASVRAARATYIAGASGSSNVMADFMFDIPSYGTHAHSWIMSFDSEMEAYSAYFEVFGDKTVALIDTYDTVEGAKKAASLPGNIKGVRLDSGDLTQLSKEVRQVLQEFGKEDGRIFASSDLDEYSIEKMLEDGAEIDVFGVGTGMILSKDSPSMGGVYKLASIEKDGEVKHKLKLSKDKMTYPGKKQVYREYEGREYKRDIVGFENEFEGLEELLIPVIRKGELIYDIPSLNDSREFFLANLQRLPEKFRRTEANQSYVVEISTGLSKEAQKLKEVIQNGI